MVVENRPAAHGWQAFAPLELKVPAGQAAQLADCSAFVHRPAEQFKPAHRRKGHIQWSESAPRWETFEARAQDRRPGMG